MNAIGQMTKKKLFINLKFYLFTTFICGFFNSENNILFAVTGIWLLAFIGMTA